MDESYTMLTIIILSRRIYRYINETIENTCKGVDYFNCYEYLNI